MIEGVRMLKFGYSIPAASHAIEFAQCISLHRVAVVTSFQYLLSAADQASLPFSF